ncbi:N-formylglutamate amidohydrolase [Sphingomonas sp. ASV193]|uniref:N-formylglutamate amidohydrolase n=1 Tax=Sphingomonas sp. ASV193 TaxID=3144405 RepID=UPI0032E90C13
MADDSPWFRTARGTGAVVATAIHDGSAVRPEALAAMALGQADRLREEDPFTGQAVVGVPNHLVVNRSRFEVDINRSRETAIYKTPEQSWGLKVWKAEPDATLCDDGLTIHDAYYSALKAMLDDLARTHSKFVLLDVHSYNHRRGGAGEAPTPQAEAPDINIGTFSMPRDEWEWLLDPLIETMRGFDFAGRRLDVRENVAFEGKGEQTRFVHATYPGVGCAIAIEFKKIYMDEWTGKPDPACLAAMRGLIDAVAAHAQQLLDR